MCKLYFLLLIPTICFSQQVYDTLKLFNDTTIFVNETIIVTDNICNAAVQLKSAFERTKIEKIWFCHPRGIGDTNHYYFDYAISVGENPEDSILFVSSLMDITEDYPVWQEVEVPGVSILDPQFYISREILFQTAHSVPTVQTHFQYLKDCDVNYWFEAIDDFYLAVKVLVSNDISSVEDYKNLKYELFPNYPNPFNPSTTIQFELPERSPLEISIYNSVGEKIEEILNSELEAGTYNILYNAINLSSGVYFYRMQTKAITITRKMIYAK